MNGMSLKKVNSLLPKIDEVRYIANITKASIIGISETKLDETILSSELEVDGYVLIRLDRLGRGFCSFSINTEKIFVDTYLPNKSKQILLGILYRPPDKHINYILTEARVLPSRGLKYKSAP